MKIELTNKDIENLENAAHQARTYYIKCGLTLEREMLRNTMDAIAAQKATGGKR